MLLSVCKGLSSLLLYGHPWLLQRSDERELEEPSTGDGAGAKKAKRRGKGFSSRAGWKADRDELEIRSILVLNIAQATSHQSACLLGSVCVCVRLPSRDQSCQSQTKVCVELCPFLGLTVLEEVWRLLPAPHEYGKDGKELSMSCLCSIWQLSILRRCANRFFDALPAC